MMDHIKSQVEKVPYKYMACIQRLPAGEDRKRRSYGDVVSNLVICRCYFSGMVITCVCPTYNGYGLHLEHTYSN